MEYEGYIVISRATGKIVGGYPQAGDAEAYTRLGNFGNLSRELYEIVRIGGEA